MQSDLISRSALIEHLNKYKFGAISNDSVREYTREVMLCFVNGMPTAYDVEKVISKLCWESHMPTTEDEDSWILLDDAIKIVRNGGKE